MENDERLDQLVAQERAVERFAEASEDETLALIEDLTATMRAVVEDEGLWNMLAEASARAEGAGQLQQLVLVDWEALLDQWGMPDAEVVALELIEAVTHANEPGGWQQARGLLMQLTEMLESDLREPQLERPGWFSRLRGRAAAGFSALRRVRIGMIAAQGGLGMTEGVAPVLLGAAFGVAPLGVAMVAGAGVAGLGFGLFRGLRDATRRSSEEVPSDLRSLFASPALSAAASGAASADLDVISALYANGGWCSEIGDLLVDLRLWAARIGATLVTAWPMVGAFLGGIGLRAIERVTIALLDFQRTLRQVAVAASGADRSLLGHAIDRAHHQVEKIADGLWQLEGLVTHR